VLNHVLIRYYHSRSQSAELQSNMGKTAAHILTQKTRCYKSSLLSQSRQTDFSAGHSLYLPLCCLPWPLKGTAKSTLCRHIIRRIRPTSMYAPFGPPSYADRDDKINGAGKMYTFRSANHHQRLIVSFIICTATTVNWQCIMAPVITTAVY